MKIVKLKNMGVAILDRSVQIKETGDLLDIMASVSYSENFDKLGMIIHKDSLGEKFFDLKTKFAGEILQKFSNYNVALAIAGDFSQYTSKSLKDFIRECNRGRQVFFVKDEDAGLNRFSELRI